jgi:hypothetical protein
MSKIQKKVKSKQLMIGEENKEIEFSNEPQNVSQLSLSHNKSFHNTIIMLDFRNIKLWTT